MAVSRIFDPKPVGMPLQDIFNHRILIDICYILGLIPLNPEYSFYGTLPDVSSYSHFPKPTHQLESSLVNTGKPAYTGVVPAATTVAP